MQGFFIFIFARLRRSHSMNELEVLVPNDMHRISRCVNKSISIWLKLHINMHRRLTVKRIIIFLK